MKITGEQNADLAGETLEITYYGYLAKTEASMDKPVDNKITVTADTTKEIKLQLKVKQHDWQHRLLHGRLQFLSKRLKNH